MVCGALTAPIDLLNLKETVGTTGAGPTIIPRPTVDQAADLLNDGFDVLWI